MDGLRELQGRYPVIGDVRGLGLMVGVEFTLADGMPATNLVKEIIARSLENKLILLNCGTYGNVVRWIPPLIVSQEQIRTGLQVFAGALAASV